MPQGLLHRFILIILIPMMMLQIAVLGFFFNRHWNTVSHRLSRDVVGEIGAVASLIQEQNLSGTEVEAVIRALNERLFINLYFEKGAKLSDIPKTTPRGTMKILIGELKELKYPFSIHETDREEAAVSIQLNAGVLHSLISKKRFFSSTVYVFLIWLLGFSVLLFWIAFLFMKNQVRSIERLSRAAEAFGRGQAVEAFKPAGAQEVKQAGLSFIQMRNRIQRYLSERTGMLSGVSHDLRTPLTRMKLQLSMLQPSEAVEDLKKDVAEMEHMLEAYLSFARGEGKEAAEKIALNPMLEELVGKLQKSGQKIDFHQECEVECICRPNEILRAVTNILTNAGRYAKKSQLKLGIFRHMARLIIDDDGPGIPPKKRNDVFRAFYRLEESRNAKTGGIGLGLTITRDIILAHGGDIDLGDSPMGGLRVTIRLPLADK
ncbi:MAG: two-component sensor histidine kinase [Alphaproteobacteria bacterium]|nr:two-component sensor histidine kinase [Alphaproteobacteria bacterium]